MMGRLRDGFYGLCDELSVRFRLFRRRRPARDAAPAVRGSMRNVLVVDPRSEIFREAIFILRDDYFQSPGVSRQELLRQARDAARNYLDAYVPPDACRAAPPALWILLPLLCVLAAVLLIVLL